MRGKGLGIQSSGQVAGITPAHAGKSSDQRQRLRLRWDHPRTCGEKMPNKPGWCLVRGSPPHMRGKVLSGGHRAAEKGITPAHAGKSASQPRCLPGWRDHPRTCGEKGTAPPAKHGVLWITPAHAGKRELHDALQGLIMDHPRTCGEKHSPVMYMPLVPGSPPHMRGKATGRPGYAAHPGITPAHAGKSDS